MTLTARWAIAAGLAACAILPHCGGKETESEEVVRPVRYERVFATGGARVRTFSGTARSGVESRLSFKVGGTVEAVNVKVGDRVAKGTVIARIDARDRRLTLQETKASLEQAEAQLRNARSAYDRVRALYENRNASKQDLDGARATFESARAQVESIQKRYELAGLQVAYCELRAPFEGDVARVDVEVNENIGAGGPVVTLTAGDRPEVEIAVPEALIAQIRPGSEGTVAFDALPDRVFEAEVVEVGVSSQGFATTFPVTLRILEAAPEVLAGMAAEASFRFETGSLEERIVVPSVAVGEDREGRFVWVLTPTEGDLAVVRRTAVVVGELTSEGLEVLEGLAEGDLIVTAGVSRITDGQTVRLL